MKLLINFSSRLLPLVLLALVVCTACAPTRGRSPQRLPVTGKLYRIALFPVENLSGAKAPLKELRQSLADQLREGGVEIIPDELFSQFMARHRLRHVGGINDTNAVELRDELGADAALFVSLEFYSPGGLPKIALHARLVSAADPALILWMDGTGMAGDDAPGLFETGMVRDGQQLMNKAMQRLTGSLLGHLSGEAGGKGAAGSARTLAPKTFYRSPLKDEKVYRVAVLPFANRSDRKYAGEIMLQHFVRELSNNRRFQVIEPGVVRQGLLQYRVVMDEGLSLANAELIFSALQADLLVSGKVTEYLDSQSGSGEPRVGFSSMFMDRASGRVVAASDGYAGGNDHVVFFDFGRISTANALAAEMVRGIFALIDRPSGASGAEKPK